MERKCDVYRSRAWDVVRTVVVLTWEEEVVDVDVGEGVGFGATSVELVMVDGVGGRRYVGIGEGLFKGTLLLDT